MRLLLCCLLWGAPCGAIRQHDWQGLEDWSAVVADSDVESAGSDALGREGGADELAAKDGRSRDQLRWWWRSQPAPHPFNAAVVSRLFSALGQDATPAACGMPLYANATVNRSMWQYIRDNSNQFFLTRKIADQQVQNAVLFSNDRSWDGIQTPHGALPVVPGMKLVEVAGTPSIGWTWFDLLQAVPFTDASIETFEFAFQAGYDLRDCWGDTITRDTPALGVCDPVAMARLSDGLRGAAAELIDGEIYETTNVPGFTVRTMQDAEVSLLRRVAPLLKADADRRLQEQEGLCYRSALAPICAVIQLPGVCRGTDAACQASGDSADVYWVAQRKVEHPSASKSPVMLNQDAVDSVELQGPQTHRFFRSIGTVFKGQPAWHREDSGFMSMFPRGIDVDSCGSREAALVLLFDSQDLAKQGMTSYPLTSSFYSQESGQACECSGLREGQTLWPMVLSTQLGAEEHKLRLVVGITNWLNQDSRHLFQLGNTARAPDSYRNNFMRMWPQYFRLEERILDENASVILASSNEPAEKMERSTKVRVLQKIKYDNGVWGLFCRDCKNTLVKDGQNMTLYIKQMPQMNSNSSPGGSNFKLLPGDTGEVVDIMAPTGQAAFLVVRFDKYAGRPAPLFKVFANQVVDLNRRVAEDPTTPAPLPSTTTPGRGGNEGRASMRTAGIALLLAAVATSGALLS